jgi:hypothetical protein
MRRYPGAFGDLNVSGSERCKALFAGVFWVVTVLVIAGVVPSWTWPVAIAAIVWVHRGLIAVFHRGGGAMFALVATLFHQLHLVYSAATYVWCSLRPRVR